jgi:two-component system, chemotaxis family, sensor histidine kinase and response regulator PixL
MMGFATLSELAHRLEDGMKVLKIQRNTLQVDAELEALLLGASDRLRQISQLNRQSPEVDANWLSTDVLPIFDQLHERLGDPSQGDEAAILSDENGQGMQDMITMLFETEVDGCLVRLEAVLANPDLPCLREEIVIISQELDGLGIMLQLPAFSTLCQVVGKAAQDTPDGQLEAFGKQALATWRRAQAVAQIGQLDAIPTSLEAASAPMPLPIAAPTKVNPTLPAPTANPAIAPSESSVTPDVAENSVRIPIKRLDQLSELFGELVIERTALNLHLDRIRNQMRLMQQRIRNLEGANTRLRNTYDKIATQSIEDSSRVIQRNPAHTASLSALDLQSLESAGFDVLEMDRYSDLHLISQEIMESIVQLDEVAGDMDFSLGDAQQSMGDLNRTSRQVQTTLTQARMRPLSDLTARFPRSLRDWCLQYGKQVQLDIVGAATLVERSILEALSDPLMHLLRNAFDHGIEAPEVRQAQGKPIQGRITIRAAYRGNQTIITLQDDGGGINLEKVRAKAERMGFDRDILANASEKELLELIFEPGFSTAEQVSALSGRGVGLDVVRTNIRQIRGDLKVETQPGQGSMFILSVPFTLSVARVLLVESNGLQLAIPADEIEEMVLLKSEQVLMLADAPVLQRDGMLIPLVNLSQSLMFNCPSRPISSDQDPVINHPSVLMVSRGTQVTAIQVDRCWGEQEIAIRQVEGKIPLPPGFSGCTILGSGQIVPLLNPTKLLEWIENPSMSASSSPSFSSSSLLSDTDEDAVSSTAIANHTILVVDDSINVRRFLAMTLEKAGYRIEEARDGQEAVDKLRGGLNVQAVICDIEMPRLDGFGVLAQIKSDPAFASLPISMLTSRSGDKHRRLAMNLGASAYFGKPFKEQELLQVLADLIHNSQNARNMAFKGSGG